MFGQSEGTFGLDFNQYCHVVVRKNQGRLLGNNLSRAMPTSLLSLLYSTIILYDSL